MDPIKEKEPSSDDLSDKHSSESSASENEFLGGIKSMETAGDMTVPDKNLEMETFLDSFKVKGRLVNVLLQLKDRRWLATCRTPIDFAHHKKFSIPSSREDLFARLKGNSHYFLTNYAILLVLMLAYSLLTRPLLIILIGFLGYLWLVISKKDSFKITDNFQIGGKTKYGLFMAFSLIVWILFAGSIIVVVFITFSLLVTLHLIFRQRVETSEENGYSEVDKGPYP